MEVSTAKQAIGRFFGGWREIHLPRLPGFLDAPFELLLPTRNPIFMRSLRSKMRGGRSYFFLVLYVIALLVVLGFVAMAYYADRQVRTGTAEAEQIGRAMFLAMIITQASLILLFTPISTCSFIAGELEKQTYEMLSLTILRDSTILCGELLATFCFIFLLTFATLPVAGVCLMIGGVSLTDMLYAEAFLLLTALFWSGLGLCVAASMRKRIASLMVTLLIMIFMNLLIPWTIAEDELRFLLAFNPVIAIPAFVDPVYNMPYFNRTLPVLPVTLALSFCFFIFFVISATRWMRNPKRAPLSLPAGIVLLALLLAHLMGGMWQFTGSESLFFYGLAVTALGVLAVIFLMDCAPPPHRFSGFFLQGESPLAFILVGAVGVGALDIYGLERASLTQNKIPDIIPFNMILELAAILFAVFFAFWALGRLFQSLTGRRRDLRALLFVVFILWSLVPPILISGYNQIIWSSEMLWWVTIGVKASPVWALFKLSGPSIKQPVRIMLAQGPSAVTMCVSFHVALGVLAMIWCHWRERKRRGVVG